MSCNAWMECTVTVHGQGRDEAVREWNGADRTREDHRGNLRLWTEWDSAGWFHDAVETLENHLRSLALATTAWSAHVRYEYYDEPSADGSFCEFDVIDGKMENFKESYIEMVEAEPWEVLDLHNTEEP